MSSNRRREPVFVTRVRLHLAISCLARIVSYRSAKSGEFMVSGKINSSIGTINFAFHFEMTHDRVSNRSTFG